MNIGLHGLSEILNFTASDPQKIPRRVRPILLHVLLALIRHFEALAVFLISCRSQLESMSCCAEISCMLLSFEHLVVNLHVSTIHSALAALSLLEYPSICSRRLQYRVSIASLDAPSFELQSVGRSCVIRKYVILIRNSGAYRWYPNRGLP